MSASLRSLRECAGLSTAEVVRRTGLPLRTVHAIEQGSYADLPAGIYARAAVRSYARAVGADCDAALREVETQLPQARLDLEVIAELRMPRDADASGRCAIAAVVDAAIVVVIWVTFVGACGLISGIAPLDLVRTAPAAMAVVLSVPAGLYFWLLGAAGVATLGPRLVGVQVLSPPAEPLSLSDWAKRGFVYIVREFRALATV